MTSTISLPFIFPPKMAGCNQLHLKFDDVAVNQSASKHTDNEDNSPESMKGSSWGHCDSCLSIRKIDADIRLRRSSGQPDQSAISLRSIPQPWGQPREKWSRLSEVEVTFFQGSSSHSQSWLNASHVSRLGKMSLSQYCPFFISVDPCATVMHVLGACAWRRVYR